MAAYNAAKYLEKSINSVVGQTFCDYELILIDDGSIDDTLSIMRRYARLDDRVQCHSQHNAGPAMARNFGISRAQGKWIAILDADDVAIPERLELQLAYVKTNPDVVLLGSGCIEIDAVGRHIKEHRYPSKHASLVRSMEMYRGFPPHSSCLYHTETVRRVDGFNPRFIRSQDLDLWLRLSEVGEIACLRQPLVKVRKHLDSISHHRAGDSQRIMGMAARICHFLRLWGYRDPSSEDGEIWSEFLEWLRRGLEDRGYFDRGKWWQEIRRDWYGTQAVSAARKALKLTRAMILSQYGIAVLRDRLLGSSLPRELSCDWVEFSAKTRLRG